MDASPAGGPGGPRRPLERHPGQGKHRWMPNEAADRIHRSEVIGVALPTFSTRDHLGRPFTDRDLLAAAPVVVALLRGLF